jgi:hypothetical protein
VAHSKRVVCGGEQQNYTYAGLKRRSSRSQYTLTATLVIDDDMIRRMGLAAIGRRKPIEQIYDIFPFANWISRDLHKCKMGNRIQATMFSSVLLSRAQKPDSYVQLETNVFGRSILNTNKQ